LEKNPDRFFWTDFSGDEDMPGSSTPPAGGMPFVGEFFPDIGSALVYDEGREYSLWSSRLLGGVWDEMPDPVTEGGPARVNIVMPSVGYSLCGT
jgi:hypothetical protein